MKVKVVALAHCSGPRQQQHVRTTGVLASLAKGLCHVFHNCTSMPFLVGYAAVVIEILLMLAGDVERNPGPGEWYCQGNFNQCIDSTSNYSASITR